MPESSDPPRPAPPGDASPDPGPAGGALAERALSGDDPRLSGLAARGLLPLPPEESIPLQVRIAEGDDEALAGQAVLALLGLETRVVVPFLERDAGPRELAWFADKSDDPDVLEAVLRRRDVPRRILVELAPRIPPDLQEVLVHRQDAILEEPAIVDSLEGNPELSTYVRRRLREYRQHLLPREERPAEEEEPRDDGGGEPSEQEVRDAIEAAREQAVEEGEKGEKEESTGLTEAQIRFLPVPVRMQLARGAPRGLRALLIRDPNPQVAKMTLRSNRFSEQEIERIASNRNIDDEVLGEIGREREWISKYRIVLALVRNPRTPVGLGVKLVPRLSVRDLRNLSRDHGVPEPVRSTAQRLYRIKRA